MNKFLKLLSLNPICNISKKIKLFYIIMIPIVIVSLIYTTFGIMYVREYNKQNELWRPTAKAGDSCRLYIPEKHTSMIGKIDSVSTDSFTITITVPKSIINKK